MHLVNTTGVPATLKTNVYAQSEFWGGGDLNMNCHTLSTCFPCISFQIEGTVENTFYFCKAINAVSPKECKCLWWSQNGDWLHSRDIKTYRSIQFCYAFSDKSLMYFFQHTLSSGFCNEIGVRVTALYSSSPL